MPPTVPPGADHEASGPVVILNARGIRAGVPDRVSRGTVGRGGGDVLWRRVRREDCAGDRGRAAGLRGRTAGGTVASGRRAWPTSLRVEPLPMLRPVRTSQSGRSRGPFVASRDLSGGRRGSWSPDA